MFDSSDFIKTFMGAMAEMDPSSYYDDAIYPITEEQLSTLPLCVVSAFRFPSNDDNVTEFSTTIDFWARDEQGQYADTEAKCDLVRAGLDGKVLPLSKAYAVIYYDDQQPVNDPEIELICTRQSYSGRIFHI